MTNSEVLSNDRDLNPLNVANYYFANIIIILLFAYFKIGWK